VTPADKIICWIKLGGGGRAYVANDNLVAMEFNTRKQAAIRLWARTLKWEGRDELYAIVKKWSFTAQKGCAAVKVKTAGVRSCVRIMTTWRLDALRHIVHRMVAFAKRKKQKTERAEEKQEITDFKKKAKKLAEKLDKEFGKSHGQAVKVELTAQKNDEIARTDITNEAEEQAAMNRKKVLHIAGARLVYMLFDRRACCKITRTISTWQHAAFKEHSMALELLRQEDDEDGRGG